MPNRGPSIQNTLNTLTDLLYESVLDEKVFAQFFGALAQATDSHFAGIEIVNPAAANHCQWQVDATYGLPHEALVNLNQTFAPHNPFVNLVADDATESSIYFDSDVMKKKQFKNMLYYDEFLRHYDFEHISGLYVMHEPHQSVIASTSKGRAAGPFTERDRTLFKLIIPHIQKFIRINERLGETDIERDLSWGALHRMSQAVLAVDRSGKVLFANDAARALADLRDGLMLNAEKLSAASATINARLYSALGKVCSAYEDIGSFQSEYNIVVPRKSGLRPFLVNLMPLRHETHLSSVNSAAALVFITDLNSQATVRYESLVDIYGLTKTEARVAALLSEGLPLEQIAQRLDHSVHTTRTVLKRIYSKTDTHRQSELVSLLLRGVASRH
ncbi:MAG: helix-turn-helix transcriptional regulator [Halioglobus sp.]